MIKLIITIVLSILINISNAQDTIVINFPDELALIRQGDVIRFTTNYNAKEFSWEFEGANIKSSNLKNPIVKYSNIGNFNIKLSIKNKNTSVINQKRAVAVTYPKLKGNKTHRIYLNGDHFWLNNDKLNVLPGDIVILTGHAAAVAFIDFKGTKSNPIRIINNGIVNIDFNKQGGLRFINSHYIIFDGQTLDEPYGFKIASKGKTNHSAVYVGGLSSNIEIFGIEIVKSGFAGIMAKTDPSPDDPKAWRFNYVLSNLKLHHNYIHDTKGEGMYIGYFTYEEKNGVKAHSVKNTKVWANKFENIGWDGFQIGCADYNTEVHNNTINNYGTDDKQFHTAGMSINSGFNGKIYNNTIQNGTGPGIIITPLDSASIYNNTISNVGKNSYGIYIQATSATHCNYNIDIHNNYIDAPTSLMIHNKNKSKIANTIAFINNILVYSDTNIKVNFKRITTYPTYLYSYNYNGIIPKDCNIITATPIKFNNTVNPNQYYFGNINYLYTIRKKIR